MGGQLTGGQCFVETHCEWRDTENQQYGRTLIRQITFFPAVNWLTYGFFYATL